MAARSPSVVASPSTSSSSPAGPRPAVATDRRGAGKAGRSPPRVALVGQPNAGKSTLFNAIVGYRAVASNFPGTTVEALRGRANVGGRRVEVVDLPGTYSLLGGDLAERVTREFLLSGDVDAVIQVADASLLGRSLALTLELAELGIPMVLCLNMMDEAEHKGISIDVDALADLLGIPVVAAVASRGQGLSELLASLPAAKPARRPPYTADVERALAQIAATLADRGRAGHGPGGGPPRRGVGWPGGGDRDRPSLSRPVPAPPRVGNVAVVALAGWVLTRLFPGEGPGLILEIPLYRRPRAKNLLGKTWLRLKGFVALAWPLLAVSSGLLGLAEALEWARGLNASVRFLTWPLGLPSEAGIPLVLGILRKELSLVMLDRALVGGVAALTHAQMIVFTVFVLFYVPCLATVGALGKELGWRRTGLVVLGTTAVGLLLGALVRLLV